MYPSAVSVIVDQINLDICLPFDTHVNYNFYAVERADVIIFFCGHVYHERCVNKRSQVSIPLLL